MGIDTGKTFIKRSALKEKDGPGRLTFSDIRKAGDEGFEFGAGWQNSGGIGVVPPEMALYFYKMGRLVYCYGSVYKDALVSDEAICVLPEDFQDRTLTNLLAPAYTQDGGPGSQLEGGNIYFDDGSELRFYWSNGEDRNPHFVTINAWWIVS